MKPETQPLLLRVNMWLLPNLSPFDSEVRFGSSALTVCDAMSRFDAMRYVTSPQNDGRVYNWAASQDEETVNAPTRGVDQIGHASH